LEIGVGRNVCTNILGLARRKTLQHCCRKWRLDGINVLSRWATSDFDDAVQLVHGACAGEHWLATQELTKNATDRPHVDTLGVLGRAKKNLGCTVPTSSDVVGQHRVVDQFVLQRSDRARKTEISDLEEALGIEQQVAGLHVSMQHIARVHVLERLAQLVNDVLLVDVLQNVCTNHSMEIGF
jgi:hypothetical protein